MKHNLARITGILVILLGTTHCSDNPSSNAENPKDSASEPLGIDTVNNTDSTVDSVADTVPDPLDSDTGTDTEAEIDTVIVDRVDVAALVAVPPDFEQSTDANGPIINGPIIIEAEDYTMMIPSSDESTWLEVSAPENFSGTGAMQAGPSEYALHKEFYYAQNNAPILVYTVHFQTAGTYSVWGRASHLDGYTDSVWFGKNGRIEGTSPLSFWDSEHIYLNTWFYIHFLMEGAYAVLDIPEPGIHTFELYMREPGFLIDQIVLSSNPDFDPADLDTL